MRVGQQGRGELRRGGLWSIQISEAGSIFLRWWSTQLTTKTSLLPVFPASLSVPISQKSWSPVSILRYSGGPKRLWQAVAVMFQNHREKPFFSSVFPPPHCTWPPWGNSCNFFLFLWPPICFCSLKFQTLRPV